MIGKGGNSLDDLLGNVTPNGFPEKMEDPDGMQSSQGDVISNEEADEELSDDDAMTSTVLTTVKTLVSSEDDSDISDSYLTEVATSVPSSRVLDQKRHERRSLDQPTFGLEQSRHLLKCP